MKRVFLLILLGMLVFWFAMRREAVSVRNREYHPQTHLVTARPDHRFQSETRKAALEAQREARKAIRKAHEDARQALAEARHEVNAAVTEAQEAGHEVQAAVAEAQEEVRHALREASDELRETVDGIPVPIVAGSRVDEALPQPPTPPDRPVHPLAEALPEPPVPPVSPGFPGLLKQNRAVKPSATPPPEPDSDRTRVVAGLVSATEERARNEARKELDNQVRDWLGLEGVPASWRPSTAQIDAMILQTTVEPVVKDYGMLYMAKLTVDVSPGRRAGFVHDYQQQLVHRRMVLLGGGLVFSLICLAALSGYIRADEATKGYYTNRLRLLAAAGVGAAGMAIYRVFV
jgi:hypothetical protein